MGLGTRLPALVLLLAAAASAQLPSGFVYLSDVEPSIMQEMRYFGQHNFIGRNVPGYLAPKCILTEQAAAALAQVQQVLLSLSFSLKVYDCYRPVMAVAAFAAWANTSDTLMAGEFYPTTPKSELFALGYIAYNSSHSRGSTVDITIVPNPPPQEEQYVPGMPLVPCFAPFGVRFNDSSIDMGTGFDCFSTLANTNNTEVGALQLANRHFLGAVMAKVGFVNLPEEWWHFTLHPEPFPDTYFNFPVQ